MPNTIAENLQRLQNARTAISTAITKKGGTVPTGAGFEDFSTAINTIAGNTSTITAAPPISFRSNGEPLVDWEIEGSSGGVGKRTKNLLEITVETQTKEGITWTIDKEAGTITASGKASSNNNTLRLYIPVSSSDRYLYFSGCPANNSTTQDWYIIVWDDTIKERCTMWDGTSSQVQTQITNKDSGISYSAECLIPANHVCIMYLRIFNTTETYSGIVFYPMLREANTSTTFIPYGYEIPVTCGGSTTDIFIGDAPLVEGESITKAEANADIPTLNGNNTLVVDTVAQPDSVMVEYYNYVAGIPYNTDGLCLYFPNDIGRVRLTLSTVEAPDVSKLNGMANSLSEFDNTTVEIRFEMPENFTEKARLFETAGISLSLNGSLIEISINGVWHENFVTSFVGGEVYTISVTIGFGDLKLYVNGVLAETDTYATFSLAGPIKTICNGGSIGMDNRWFPATSDISKVRVYDRVLTAAEIAANYQIDNPT